MAIIFPAIIQLCTFWHQREDEQEQEEEEDKRDKEEEQGTRWSPRWICLTRGRSLSWSLFMAKNCFLILFGILGLITGSWVSLSQLSAVYLSV